MKNPWNMIEAGRQALAIARGEMTPAAIWICIDKDEDKSKRGFLIQMGNESVKILRDIDLPAFYAWCEAHGKPFPLTNSDGAPRDEVALAAIHKARLFHYAITGEEREASRAWLIGHGYKPAIFDREM